MHVLIVTAIIAITSLNIITIYIYIYIYISFCEISLYNILNIYILYKKCKYYYFIE